MVSVGASGGSSQSSGSVSGFRGLFRKPAQQLAGIFGEVLKGGTGALSNPLGIIGPQFNALYGADPSQDFMGARKRITDLISGEGMSRDIETAFGSLLPTIQRSIDESSRSILNQSAGQGLRFSSDVMNQSRDSANDLLSGGMANAIQLALGSRSQQLEGAQNVFSNVGSLAEAQLARQIPLLAQLLAQMGKSRSFGEGGGGWNLAIAKTGK